MPWFDIIIDAQAGSWTESIEITDLVIAGWVGRDREAMEHHIRELEALGIVRPRRTPMFYRVSAARLTMAEQLDAAGGASSGEVECVLLAHGGALYVGVGSDHTDRKVEAYGVTVSKQVCDKPVGRHFWPLAEVAEHWDLLQLASDAEIDGRVTRYQEGAVSGLMHPLDLVGLLTDGGALPDGTVMFCGTLPAIGGIRPGTAFRGRLHDPVLARTLEVGYRIRTLAVAD